MRFASRLGLTVINGLLVLVSGSARAAESSPPNVVLILADDLGWTDLACYGSDTHETPRLDEFAQGGLRFTQAYAMSVCTPSRAMLMTGRHAARLGITTWSEGALNPDTDRPLLPAVSRPSLPRSEITLAERFRTAGYLTAAIGKWHLGDASHFPETQGFDINVGGNHWGAPMTFWWPYRGSGRFGPEYRYVPALDLGEPGEYLTDRLTDEAIRVIDHAETEERPFFLYLAHYAPHTPIEAKRADVDYFALRTSPFRRHQHPVYAAMIRSLDESVGRVLDRLRESEMGKNTIVIFASDNGGYIGSDPKSGWDVAVTSNAPLRSGKGSLYEGGIRVPLIIRWPGKTRSGSVCDTPVSLADLFPTLTDGMADPTDPNDDPYVTLDGIDLKPLIEDPTLPVDRGPLYFHFPHYYPTTTPAGAIREGDWKLIEYLEDGRSELYHLATDPGEQQDRTTSAPQQWVDLRQKLAAWRAKVGAAMPTPNPPPPAPRSAAASQPR